MSRFAHLRKENEFICLFEKYQKVKINCCLNISFLHNWNQCKSNFMQVLAKRLPMFTYGEKSFFCTSVVTSFRSDDHHLTKYSIAIGSSVVQYLKNILEIFCLFSKKIARKKDWTLCIHDVYIVLGFVCIKSCKPQRWMCTSHETAQ